MVLQDELEKLEKLTTYLQKIINNIDLDNENIIKHFSDTRTHETIRDIINFIKNNKNKITEIVLYKEKKSIRRKIHFKYKCHCSEISESSCRNMESFQFNCKKCTAKKNGATTKKDTDTFLEELFIKYPYFSDKNKWEWGKYTHSLKPIEYMCLTHNQKCSQTPSHLLQTGGFGCKICSNQGNSRESIMLLEYLTIIFKKKIIHSYNNRDGEHCLDNYSRPIDGYIENIDYNFIEEKLKEYSLEYILENVKYYLKNLNNNYNKFAFEYNGSYYHCNPKKYTNHYIGPHNKNSKMVWEHDEEKYKTYNKNGYTVVVIWDDDFKKIKNTDFYKEYQDKIEEKIKKYDFSKQKVSENQRITKSYNNKKHNLNLDNRKRNGNKTKNMDLPTNICRIKNGYFFQFGIIKHSFSDSNLNYEDKLNCAKKIRKFVIDNFNILSMNGEKVLTDEDNNKLKEKTKKIYNELYSDKIILSKMNNCIKEICENNIIIGYEINNRINKIRYNKKVFLKDKFNNSSKTYNGQTLLNTTDECVKCIMDYVNKKKQSIMK